MLYSYDGQIRRYLLQIIRLLSNFVVKYGDGSLVRIPVMYGDQDRQAATILNQNSENNMQSTPKIAVYVYGLELDRNRLADASFVGKTHIREREIVNGQYTTKQGSQYTIEKLMPTPFKLTVKVDIWSSSTEQKFQILEQLLVFFNPSLEIQTTDNYVDWASLSVVELDNIVFSSRQVPTGTNTAIDIATLTLSSPIWITTPAKVKKLGIITSIISNIFGNNAQYEDMLDAGLGNDPSLSQEAMTNPMTTIYTTVGNYDILVSENQIKVTNNGSPDWVDLFSLYPGKFIAGLSKIGLSQPDGTEVIGYASINSLDPSILSINWDIDTFPSNTPVYGPARTVSAHGSFDAIVDPTTRGPNGAGLTPTVGTRYMLVDSIGGGISELFTTTTKLYSIDTGISFDKVVSCTVELNNIELVLGAPVNRDGNYVISLITPIDAGNTLSINVSTNDAGSTAWRNLDGSDVVAGANDIIEWDGSKWHVVFSARNSDDLFIYQTNLYTLVQYKWNGISWSKSFEGEYEHGKWRIQL